LVGVGAVVGLVVGLAVGFAVGAMVGLVVEPVVEVAVVPAAVVESVVDVIDVVDGADAVVEDGKEVPADEVEFVEPEDEAEAEVVPSAVTDVETVPDWLADEPLVVLLFAQPVNGNEKTINAMQTANNLLIIIENLFSFWPQGSINGPGGNQAAPRPIRQSP